MTWWRNACKGHLTINTSDSLVDGFSQDDESSQTIGFALPIALVVIHVLEGVSHVVGVTLESLVPSNLSTTIGKPHQPPYFG